MKKAIILTMSSVLLLSSCGTYTGSTALNGTMLGGALGSAIGGLSGGGRGSDLGSIIGMAGGAAIGVAMGQAAEKKTQRLVSEHYDAIQQQKAQEQVDQSGFDANNTGDDRIEFDSSETPMQTISVNTLDSIYGNSEY